MITTQPFAELICAYLDGEPGAADVLNDALEDSGQARIAVDGTRGERLALVLEQLLVEPLANRLSVDYAQHVIQYCDSPVAQAFLRQKQTEIDPAASAEVRQAERQAAEQALRSAAGDSNWEPSALHRLGWDENVTPRSSAAWALWGALMIPVRFVADAAQRANSTELDWQINRLKQLLHQ